LRGDHAPVLSLFDEHMRVPTTGAKPLPAEHPVEVPTAYQLFPRDILHPPRVLAERAFNIQRWTVSPSGGHFAAIEEPELLTKDVRAFFRSLR